MKKKTKEISISGRTVAVLVADQVDGEVIDTIHQALKAENEMLEFLALRTGKIRTSSGKTICVKYSFAMLDSVTFDAVFIPGGKRHVDALCADAIVVGFVSSAYKDGKAIGAIGEGKVLITKAARATGAMDGKFRSPGVITRSRTAANIMFIRAFFAAITKQRFPERPDIDGLK